MTADALFAALADPTRVRILRLVGGMELSVGELVVVLGQSQPRVSRHIRILAEAGLIDRAKEGAWVFVRPASHPAVAAALAIIEAAEPGGGSSDRARLGAVRAARTERADAWFAANADSWDRERRLHVADAEIERAIGAALGGPVGRLLDIGTGTGRMIELLAPRARAALGIDRSPEMLRLARAKLAAAGLPAEVRRADMYALPVEDAAADTVVLHQVLHFADDPAAALAEAARVLAPGGRLLVADFAAHGREELRIAHAHVRLGFADEAVTGWLAAAGLEAEVAARLPAPSADGLTVTLWLARRPGLARELAA